MSTAADLSPVVSNPFGGAPIVAAPTHASQAAKVQREVAEVQAAMVVAKNYPRNQRDAVDRILMDCARPELADGAIYQYGRGGSNIEGPSIRLAEVLARGWGNMAAGVTELSRANGYSECLAYAWDLETNYRDEKRFQVRHWRDTKSGGHPLTDERDIYETIANMGARRKRACILAIIPGDVIDAAVNQCSLTLKTKIDVTPERIKAMVEKFGELGVSQKMIETKIQRRLEAITPALMVQLGKIMTSLIDGMSQVADWFEPEPPTPNGGVPVAAPTSKTDAVKQRLAAQKPPPATATTAPDDDDFDLAPIPTDQDVTDEPADPAVSEAQVKALAILATKKLGGISREERLVMYGTVLGHGVHSSKDLTQGEWRRLVDALNKLSDKAGTPKKDAAPEVQAGANREGAGEHPLVGEEAPAYTAEYVGPDLDDLPFPEANMLGGVNPVAGRLLGDRIKAAATKLARLDRHGKITFDDRGAKFLGINPGTYDPFELVSLGVGDEVVRKLERAVETQDAKREKAQAVGQ